MKVDYIIVGLGLAGLAFAEKLVNNKKSFIVFENLSQTSSLVAGGVYNPVILKRLTPVWKAKEQLEIALPFYETLEKKFNLKLDIKFSTQKVFKSIEDQNNWFTATDKPLLTEFMNPKIINKSREGVVGNFGFGEVLQTGKVDTHLLVKTYQNYLKSRNSIHFEKFDYNKITIKEVEVVYKEITAKKIVFCEGFGMIKNPYFNHLPLNEVKGELITIYAPELKIDFLLKSTLFILPLKNDLYKVGATFNWKSKTSKPSKEGRDELVEKLNKVISVPYKIVNQTAGVRPTVKDRRPLVGLHPKYKNMAILNGLGTRGVMIAPWAANELYSHIEKSESLDSEINVNRFS